MYQLERYLVKREKTSGMTDKQKRYKFYRRKQYSYYFL